MTVVISSVLFIVLGAAFVAFQGGNAFGGVYAALRAADLALQIETGVRSLAEGSPLLLAAIVVIPIVVIGLLAMRSRRATPSDRSMPE